MNKEEAKQKLHNLAFAKLNTKPDDLKLADVMRIVNQINEPQAGHAEEAPRYVKNILARLRELPLHDREVWLKSIMAEFERDFSRAKWREGYEQGKFEASLEIDKMCPFVPQMVADIIEYYKSQCAPIIDVFEEKNSNEQYRKWLINEPNAYDIVARAWFFGYEVKREKRYTVRIKATKQYLCNDETGSYFSSIFRSDFPKSELEELGFGWVFAHPGIEIKEVE